MATCNPQRPATMTLGGAQQSEDRVSLAFTPNFPCGVEMSADQTFLAPLRTVQLFSGCIGDPCEPGGLALVAGRVQSLRTTRSGEVRPLAMDDCGAGVSRKQPRVKLRVTDCKRATSFIIDADSSVVVSAGEVRIDVLVPGASAADASFAGGAWVEYGALVVPALTLWDDTRIEVSACPARGCCPCGTLSEFVATSAANTPAQRVLIAPHGARRVSVSSAVAGVPANTVVQLANDVDLNQPTYGGFTFQATDPAGIALAGDVPGIVLPAVDATVRVVWEVCGV